MEITSLKPNKGKKLTIVVDGVSYARYPVKTHLVSDKDSISELVEKYAKRFLGKDDLLLISERVVAITQGRSFLLKDIKPSWFASFLARFVSKHPGGIGLKSPWTMQLAIQEAGLWRILIAAVIAGLTRPFGIKGLFYRMVGNDINAIDGPCDYTLPPGNMSAKLGPKNPMKVAGDLAKEFNISIGIIDANDYGVRIMGHSEGIDRKLIEKVFKDNPLGQTDEQTPMAVVRKIQLEYRVK